MNQFTPGISIVLPAHNEDKNIPLVVKALMEQMKSCGLSYEIIVIDDGSRDNTWLVLMQLQQELAMDESIRLYGLQLSRNFGKEAAMCAGIEAARGKAVIIMDCDLQHPPELISQMITLWRQSDIKVVEAVKSCRGDEPKLRRFGSKLFYSSFKMLSGHDLRGSSDYKLLDRSVVDDLLRMEERNLFFRGMVGWLGYKQLKLTFDVQERASGSSAWQTRRLMKMAVEAVTAYSFVPLRIIAVTGLLFMIIAVVFALYTLAYKILGYAVSGFTTVILLQLFIGSLCMISLGVIGEYIARVYEEVKCRPRYIVSRQLLPENQSFDNHPEDRDMKSPNEA